MDEYCTTFDITTPLPRPINRYTYFPSGCPPIGSCSASNQYYYLQKLNPITSNWEYSDTGVIYVME